MVNGRDKWLNPSAALTRFNPPEGAVTAIQAAERKQRSRYGFLVSDIGLLIHQDTTSEVIEQIPVYPIPHMPSWLPGLINLRGNLIPVFDLKLFLGLEQHDEQQKQWLLILGTDDQAVSLFCDGLPRIVDTTHPLGRLPPLPTALRPHAVRAYAYEGIIWSEFDHEHFFKSASAQIASTA
ncbi:MAG: chemotaxis protein CheW [Candidatus Competibacteraceae bacterium]|jgi:twitching motility protein PilI|nr:chemotaxis protein CheW [Candidatus Competibacteraceae bacterium]